MSTLRHTLNLKTTYARVEFWGAATIFAFVLFFFLQEIGDVSNAPFKEYFREAGIPFHYYRDYFFPQLVRNFGIFLGLIYLNFIVIPKLVAKENLARYIALFVLVFLLTTG